MSAALWVIDKHGHPGIIKSGLDGALAQELADELRAQLGASTWVEED